MAKKEKKETSYCMPQEKKLSCCKFESVTSIDDRGQMVLPKEIREKAKILPGEKLAVISWEKEGKVCCISLIKTEDFTGMVKGLLAPMIKDISGE
ncbi:MAG: HgcAB-associated protein HgcC [Candidatus Aminicenantaceae bacterium]